MIFLATNPFFLAYIDADAVGKIIFLGLFVLSCVCWSILIYKLWVGYQFFKAIPFFEKKFHMQKANPLTLNFEKIGKKQTHPFSYIYNEVHSKTREILHKNRFFQNNIEQTHLSKTDMELLESAVYQAISQQNNRLDKNLFILSMIVTLAPFLGLLGTVWGILVTFSGLTTHAVSTMNSIVLSGLSMALTTTVLGLIVAIPALIGYSVLKNNSKSLVKKMESFSQELLHTIEMQYRKVDL